MQGVFDPNNISGVGTNFGLLVHVLPGRNKQRALKQSFIFEMNWGTKQLAWSPRWF
jgi:hypothetical protein